MSNAPAAAPERALPQPYEPTRIGGPAWVLGQFLPRLIVGALFIYTGAGKIAAPAKFAEEIRKYELAPVATTNLMALGLPWLEVLTGLGLIVGPFRRESRILIFALLFFFTLAKSYVLWQGRNIECGCVPSDSPLKFLFNGWTGVATNVACLGLLLLEGRLTARTAHVRS